ncbi:MAG: hypothetical protein LUG16_03665 [Candidatus Gastranaerophilales bacterium]|nr:hypothetical protein [Candidatus Gastranaerophilales bacterium]
MVNSIGIQNQIAKSNYNSVSFGNNNKKTEEIESEHDKNNKILYTEKKKHPVALGLKIQTDKLKNAFTTYPKKGFEGSKNANFYEFLTMGTVPYLMGSATLIGVFNLASKFFDTPAAVSASKVGKKMGIGVLFYGLFKTFSKKLVETPVNLKYGIDNTPYVKTVNELPEERNKDNLVAKEYHKIFESVDFPRWDLINDSKDISPEQKEYFKNNKAEVKEKLIKTKLFSTVASYLWAATGVGIAMQKPWENLELNPAKRVRNFMNHRQIASAAKEQGQKIKGYNWFAKDFGKKFIDSTKEFVNNGSKPAKYAGRALLAAAVGVTLLGNFSTLFDFNKYKGSKVNGASSLIDETKEKVIC